MSWIDPVSTTLVQNAMDACMQRQAAHANNLANLQTPGYRPLTVSFEDRLAEVRNALHRDGGRDLVPADLPTAQMIEDSTSSSAGVDGEVAALSRNALHFQALTKALSRHYALMNLAVSEGHR